MDNIILILIITAYSIYKIADRVCETFDMQKESEESKIITELIEQNSRLVDELLDKEK